MTTESMGRRCGLKAIVGLFASVVVPALGGCQPDLLIDWMTLEIRDAETNSLISGATVIVPTRLFLGVDFLSEAPSETRLAPTDLLGTTLLPAVLLGSPPEVFDFLVTVQFEGEEEVLPLQTRRGEVARGQRFKVSVLGSESIRPDDKEPEAIEGSSPPTIVVDSYVYQVQFWTTNCQNPIMSVRAYTPYGGYLSGFMVGTLPQGFDGSLSQEICPELSPEQQRQIWFTVYREVYQPIPTGSDYSCVDESNTVAPCP